MELHDVDLADPDVFERGEHHQMFAVLRREDPVHWQPERDGRGFWCLTTHADVQAANRDAATFRSGSGFTLAETDPDNNTFGELLPGMDAPRHTRFRRIVNRGFTPRMLGLLEAHLAHKAGSSSTTSSSAARATSSPTSPPSSPSRPSPSSWGCPRTTAA